MALITSLLAGGWQWLAGLGAVIVAIYFSYANGKKIGKVETQAKADVAKAESKAETVKASSEHEAKVIGNANEAKNETASRTDDELRNRMRDNYTDK